MAIPKNPLLAQYKDPTSKALINQATQAGDLASKNAMEQMNSRGMLYSTSANRAVADAQNQAVTNILPQLQQMAEQRRQQAIDNQFRQRQFNADQGYRNAQLGMERQRMNQSNQTQDDGYNVWKQNMDHQLGRMEYFNAPGDAEAQFFREKQALVKTLGEDGFNELIRQVRGLPEGFQGGMYRTRH